MGFISTKLDDFCNEHYNFIKDETQWMWVSPDNRVINVPKLNHKDYIMRQYRGYDYDAIFDQAIRDGWVRVIYEKFPDRFKGELSLNGYDKERVKYVLKNIFWDLIKYGNKSVYVDYENPAGSDAFSTFTADGKAKLIGFLNEQ